MISSSSWEILYKDLDKKAYSMEITVDGHLLETQAFFEVESRGISENDYFGGI
jgi:hypothetical protein